MSADRVIFENVEGEQMYSAFMNTLPREDEVVTLDGETYRVVDTRLELVNPNNVREKADYQYVVQLW